jgi:signal transduction histidine kinase
LVEIGTPPEVVQELCDIAFGCSHPPGETLSLLVDYLREYAYVSRATGAISSANARIQSVVRDLKSYSHLDEAEESEVDLHDGIDHTLALFDHLLAPGVKVTRRFGTLPPLSVRVDQLNQVWTNLIHNALQAMGGQGQLTIETTIEKDGAVVRVIDDGPGIAPEAMPHIFEPFFTTKARGEGSGLGLKIAQQIVDRHAGRLAATSEPGRTCFEVWLPLKPQPVPAPVPKR